MNRFQPQLCSDWRDTEGNIDVSFDIDANVCEDVVHSNVVLICVMYEPNDGVFSEWSGSYDMNTHNVTINGYQVWTLIFGTNEYNEYYILYDELGDQWVITKNINIENADVLVIDESYLGSDELIRTKTFKKLSTFESIHDFPFDIKVRFSMTHLVNTADEGIDADDFDFDQIDDDWERFFSARGRFVSEYILGAEHNPTGELVIPYYLTTDDGTDPDEAFEVSILNCEVDETTGAYNPVPNGLKGLYFCEPGKYYPAVIITIQENEADGSFTSTSEGDLPLWIWAHS